MRLFLNFNTAHNRRFIDIAEISVAGSCGFTNIVYLRQRELSSL
ncbi:hypothetical protein SAMN02927903_03272 [Flavobacterium caeni]|uniref:Uncharacterized protein n=1 Tax=Flavobacterium caeni TaxID=490189 RepID=A0A1G5KGK9_9FLAO|nr:hypothetical protein SAMN02927903_03272 [Flavobacterium caeni]